MILVVFMQKGTHISVEHSAKLKLIWKNRKEKIKTLQDFYDYYNPHEDEIKKALTYYKLQKDLGKV
jgi:hypothetical protein